LFFAMVRGQRKPKRGDKWVSIKAALRVQFNLDPQPTLKAALKAVRRELGYNSGKLQHRDGANYWKVLEDDANGKTKHTLPIDLVDSDDDIYAEDDEPKDDELEDDQIDDTGDNSEDEKSEDNRIIDSGDNREDEHLKEDQSTGEGTLSQNLLLKSVIEKDGKLVIQCKRCDFEHIYTKMPAADDVSRGLSSHVVYHCPSTVNAREKLGNAYKLDCKLSSEYKLSASFEHRINSNLRLFAFYMFRLKMGVFHDFRSFSKTPS